MPTRSATGKPELDTRTRIMYEASLLFAVRGYFGTSTREIADAVGVRQPSLFHYFGAKHEILAELLDRDLIPASSRARNALRLPGPVAPRLHAYLERDVTAILLLPYDVRGLYDDEVLKLPELAGQAQRREDLHGMVRDLVRQGVSAGEFAEIDAEFVRMSITALVLEVVRTRGRESSKEPGHLGAQVADFVLGALMANPARLAAVRRTAHDVRHFI